MGRMASPRRTPIPSTTNERPAMSEAITKALDDFEIQAITTAYEQGFGHAWRTELSNPYPDGTTTRTAWQYGRDAGQRQTPQPAPSPQPAVPVVEAFAEGWRMAADWANRDDLLPDMDSPQYAKERDERLAELRPAVEPMTDVWTMDDIEQACVMVEVSPAQFESIALWLETKGRGITAKAEDAHQHTKEAE